MFSVIMPTRNRPALFREAFASVLAQSCRDLEIIVINDGSADEHRSGYEAALRDAPSERVRAITLISHPNGHGQSYAINVGAATSREPYLCFLDDDDCWTDPDHLARVQTVIEAMPTAPDLVMTNQAAYLKNEPRPGPIWIEDLPAILTSSGATPDPLGAYPVAVGDLLRSHGFCHLNTLIVRRTLYQEIGGMDETIRWECDRDLYLRLIDRAHVMRYLPVTVARHNIPDPAAASNMTTAISQLERWLYQIRVLDRAALFALDPGIRTHGRRHKAYALKKIAEALAAARRKQDAAWYARQALGAGPGAKWAAFTAWLSLPDPGRR
ncbi:MAG: glycosyltransferase family 2 protein [Acetobacteraceae bacterium]